MESHSHRGGHEGCPGGVQCQPLPTATSSILRETPHPILQSQMWREVPQTHLIWGFHLQFTWKEFAQRGPVVLPALDFWRCHLAEQVSTSQVQPTILGKRTRNVRPREEARWPGALTRQSRGKRPCRFCNLQRPLNPMGSHDLRTYNGRPVADDTHFPYLR